MHVYAFVCIRMHSCACIYVILSMSVSNLAGVPMALMGLAPGEIPWRQIMVHQRPCHDQLISWAKLVNLLSSTWPNLNADPSTGATGATTNRSTWDQKAMVLEQWWIWSPNERTPKCHWWTPNLLIPLKIWQFQDGLENVHGTSDVRNQTSTHCRSPCFSSWPTLPSL